MKCRDEACQQVISSSFNSSFLGRNFVIIADALVVFVFVDGRFAQPSCPRGESTGASPMGQLSTGRPISQNTRANIHILTVPSEAQLSPIFGEAGRPPAVVFRSVIFAQEGRRADAHFWLN